jgi:hypothetical protein
VTNAKFKVGEDLSVTDKLNVRNSAAQLLAGTTASSIVAGLPSQA